MRTWTRAEVPSLPGKGDAPKLFNTSTGRLEHPPISGGVARLYVCGITPYDATHLGHAFTYLSFDLMQRAWLDADLKVEYAQNITDVDDPLLERAAETQQDWEELAASQIALYRSDMHRLGVLPPDNFIAVTERVDEIAQAVDRLRAAGYAYQVASDSRVGDDWYFDTRAAERESQWRLGDVAPYDEALMRELSAERGGDPERPGKRDPLDPLLWRAARDGEPQWPSVVGAGRPGWHVECAVISAESLGETFTVQGGGTDLIFPHHEFTAAHATALTGTPLAHSYCHVGLIAYQGHKMSKSRGNLVFVSKLLDRGVEAGAIRLGLFAHHYLSEWEWHDADLEVAQRRLEAWRSGASRTLENRGSATQASAIEVVQQLRAALANDLDTPVMLATLDAAFDQGIDDPRLVRDAVQALLGISLA